MKNYHKNGGIHYINNPSVIINTAVQRYDMLLKDNLPEFDLEEWGTIFDLVALQESINPEHLKSFSRLLAKELYNREEIIAKWGIDTEILAQKLMELSLVQTIALIDSAEIYLTTNSFKGIGVSVRSAVMH